MTSPGTEIPLVHNSISSPSCKEIYACNLDSPSGYYWRDSSPPELMYCAMNLTRCGSTTGGWTRVAHINMTSPEGSCPSPLETIAFPRSCSRSGGVGCSSVNYSTFACTYQRADGMYRQGKHTHAHTHHTPPPHTITTTITHLVRGVS